MPSSAAEPGARRWPGESVVPGLLGGRALGVALLGCLAVAALSLLFSHTLTYDPWSWLGWGREIVHGSLSTGAGGTAWKPLPVIVDVVFAPWAAPPRTCGCSSRAAAR